MRPYNQGNLATNIRREAEKTAQKKRVTTVRYGISGAEKLIYFFTLVALAMVCSFLIARYAEISHYNYETIELKSEIKKLNEQNAETSAKIDELSKPERIRTIAEKMGLTRQDDTVRVFDGSKAAN